MPDIHPFRALRYDLARIGDLSRVVGQPYDKVDDALRDEYYARHPFHIVRIDKRKDEPDDRKYASAGADLDRWIGERILVEEARPALYAVRQTYGVEGMHRTRQGISAMVRLEEFESGKVRPHEETHAGPKVDRLKLLRAARAHIGHIFMLYPDPQRLISAVLARVTSSRAADLRAVDDYGETHEAWRIDDRPTIEALVKMFKPLEVIIADGHHRYETALAYRRECLAAGLRVEGTETYENVLATLIDMDDQGLTCFPTHRVIKDRPPLERSSFLKAVSDDFDIKTWPFEDPESEQKARRDMFEALRNDTRAFGLALPSGAHALLHIRNTQTTASRVRSERSMEWKSLDVNILHTIILERVMGITPDDTAHERYVEYVRSADKAVELVLSGHASCAFILNPVRMDQLQAVVRKGEKFPQKSTDFYPKMLSGFLMCRLRVGIA